jgi:hypothetical protein
MGKDSVFSLLKSGKLKGEIMLKCKVCGESGVVAERLDYKLNAKRVELDY